MITLHKGIPELHMHPIGQYSDVKGSEHPREEQ